MISLPATLRALRTGAAAAALVAATALSASAATITFDFTGSGGSVSGSGYANQRVYSAGGVTLTVTAWSVGSTLDRANVGHYGGNGLGVCSTADGSSNCGSPNHQADNAGAQEFVLFQFSVPVDPTSVTINPSGTYDRDLRYYVGSAAKTLATVDASLPSALGVQYDVAAAVSGNATTVALAGSSSAYTLLIGTPSVTAKNGAGKCPNNASPDCDADYWKIESLVVQYTATPPGGAGDPVPAPGALALLGTAVAGLTIARRRRG